MGLPRWMCITAMLWTGNATGAAQFPATQVDRLSCQTRQRSQFRDGTFASAPRCDCKFGSRGRRRLHDRRLGAGENHCARRVPALPEAGARRRKPPPASASRRKVERKPPSNSQSSPTRPLTQDPTSGKPPRPTHGRQAVPDSKAELPPLISRAEIVAFALVALLIICIVTVLYAGQGVLPADHDGLHRRHHAVAGGQLPRTLSHSPALAAVADRGRGRHRRRLHGRPDRLARDGMEQQASGTGRRS